METYTLCPVTFFENHTVYEQMWKNMTEPEMPQTIWRMCVARWIKSLHARKYTPVLVHPHPLQHHARTHARTRTHTQICNAYCFSTSKCCFVNASQCYVIHTMPILLLFAAIPSQSTKWSNHRVFIVSEHCERKLLSSSKQKTKL